jgi:hypothetical protein
MTLRGEDVMTFAGWFTDDGVDAAAASVRVDSIVVDASPYARPAKDKNTTHHPFDIEDAWSPKNL